MNEYTFPFDTCEKPNKNGIAQPYSSLFNLINCLIIFYFLLKTKTTYTFAFLFSILCFELFHSFSHIVHIYGPVQTNITHSITYFINFAFFYLCYNYTHEYPSYPFLIYLFLLIFFDIYAFLNLNLVYYFVSQSTVFVSLLLYYFPLLPNFIKTSVYQIISLIGIIIILFLNEKYNCQKMLTFYEDFPYHIFIEITGIVLFYVISSNFYKL
jgi:hypothetical protein